MGSHSKPSEQCADLEVAAASSAKPPPFSFASVAAHGDAYYVRIFEPGPQTSHHLRASGFWQLSACAEVLDRATVK